MDAKRKLGSEFSAMNDVHGPGGVLVDLWYRMIMKLGLTPARLEDLMKEYVEKQIAHVRRTARTTTVGEKKVVQVVYAKGNLRRELFNKPTMTIKSFFRGVKMLGFVKVRICIEATSPSGRVCTIETTVNLGKMGIAEGEEADDNPPTTTAQTD